MLISMAVYDTEENDRTWMTVETLRSLALTVDWDKHRLFVIDNGSCEETHKIYDRLAQMFPFEVIYNEANRGTAKAINQGWHWRLPGEHCVKMDNDVVFHQDEWADWMEDVFVRDPTIGICGLKRRDLTTGDSSLQMIPHVRGQRWIVVEEVAHVMGTCQAYSSALLDKIGYLDQPSLYGFDDALSAVRCRLAGFRAVFLHGFEIDHIDPGGSAFTEWKRAEARRQFPMYNSMVLLYESGVLPLRKEYDGDEARSSECV